MHKTLALAALGALALHALALVLDTTVKVSPAALLVPGLVSYRPRGGRGRRRRRLADGLVTLSFWARKRIGTRAWRRLHWLDLRALRARDRPRRRRRHRHGAAVGPALYVGAIAAVAAATAWRALTVPPDDHTGRTAP